MDLKARDLVDEHMLRFIGRERWKDKNWSNSQPWLAGYLGSNLLLCTSASKSVMKSSFVRS